MKKQGKQSIGWTPTPIDLSSWNSLWTIERIK